MGGLRASIRNSSGFGQGLNFTSSSNSGGSSSTNTSLNDSLKGSPILSPKITKTDSKDEDGRQYLMKKRSPTKVFEEGTTKEIGNINTSVNYQKN